MQKVSTLMQPIEADNPPIPLIIRVIGKKNAGYLEGGTSTVSSSQEIYVCLSQLPQDLQERVRTAVVNLLRP